MDPEATVPRLESWLHCLDGCDLLPVTSPLCASVSSPVKQNNTIFMKLNELISVKLVEQCLAQSQLYVCQIKCKKYEKEMGKEAEACRVLAAGLCILLS